MEMPPWMEILRCMFTFQKTNLDLFLTMKRNATETLARLLDPIGEPIVCFFYELAKIGLLTIIK